MTLMSNTTMILMKRRLLLRMLVQVLMLQIHILIFMSMLMSALTGTQRQRKKSIWLFVKSLGMQM
jgi:hypothetical protein